MQCVHLMALKMLKKFSGPVLVPQTPPDPLDEFGAVAERILCSLNSVFERDSLLDEFDIVPVEIQTNRSPVLHIDNKLALESWCIPFLYRHSYRSFISLTTCKSSKRIINLSDLGRKCLELSRLLLLINPDLTLGWNYRRNAFSHNNFDLSSELQFVSLVLSRKPRCSEAFNYRRWLIDEAIKTGTIILSSSSTLEIFKREVECGGRAASKYGSNYHAWNYRLHIFLTWTSSPAVPDSIKAEIIDYEMNASNSWLMSHVSDYCGYHYRHTLLKFIILKLNYKEGVKVIEDELKRNESSIEFYPSHESLWYFRRTLISLSIDFYKKQGIGNENEIQRAIASLSETELGLVDKFNKNDMCNSTKYSKWIITFFKKYL